MPIYTIGRSHLLETLHSELQSDLVRAVDDPTSRRAYEHLINLGTEFRDTGIVYKCLPATTSASPAPCRPGGAPPASALLMEGCKTAAPDGTRVPTSWPNPVWPKKLVFQPSAALIR